MKIIFLDRKSIRDEVTLTKPSFEHEWVEYDNTEFDQIIPRAKDADIIITNKVPIRKEMLDQLPNLKMIALTATGYNVIDVEDCRQRGIITSNIRGYANAAVPEHVFALLLGLRRSIANYHADVRKLRWSSSDMFTFFDYPVHDLAGSTMTIIGQGDLGNNVARIAEAFGMEVLFAERKNILDIRRGYTEFYKALEQADVISVHCPLFAETENLLSMTEFEHMKKKPMIINTARGGIVNEVEVKQALDQGLISGFGTDVLSVEPPEESHPIMAIRDYPNVLITPHMAWASVEAVETLWAQLIDNIENWHNGNPTNVV
ncbi:MAG: D-2-hydroxyacid dehydrogenase [Alphaproteobacteria bacterium]